MMRTMLLLLLAAPGLAVSAAGRAEGSSASVTATVTVMDVKISLGDLIITPKKGYTHVLWDAFPSREKIAEQSKKDGQEEEFLGDLARALVLAVLPPRRPKASKVKVDVVEFPERDEYGAPRWASVRKRLHLEFELPAPSAVKSKR